MICHHTVSFPSSLIPSELGKTLDPSDLGNVVKWGLFWSFLCCS